MYSSVPSVSCFASKTSPRLIFSQEQIGKDRSRKRPAPSSSTRTVSVPSSRRRTTSRGSVMRCAVRGPLLRAVLVPHEQFARVRALRISRKQERLSAGREHGADLHAVTIDLGAELRPL